MKKDETLKSTQLLAKGYEPVIGLTVPVGTSNKDLGVEGASSNTSLSCDVTQCAYGKGAVSKL